MESKFFCMAQGCLSLQGFLNTPEEKKQADESWHISRCHGKALNRYQLLAFRNTPQQKPHSEQ
jgi:hypothetical protein